MNRSTNEFYFQASSWKNRLQRCLAACAVVSAVHGAEVDLTPIPAGDGSYTQVTVAGQTAWQNTGASRYLYARRPDSFAFTAGQTLYVRVTYFDDAGGLVDLQYDSQTNAYTTSPLHTRTSRVGTGRFVDGYFELPDVLFTKRLNGARTSASSAGTASGAKVPVQTDHAFGHAFPGSGFPTRGRPALADRATPARRRTMSIRPRSRAR